MRRRKVKRPQPCGSDSRAVTSLFHERGQRFALMKHEISHAEPHCIRVLLDLERSLVQRHLPTWQSAAPAGRGDHPAQTRSGCALVLGYARFDKTVGEKNIVITAMSSCSYVCYRYYLKVGILPLFDARLSLVRRLPRVARAKRLYFRTCVNLLLLLAYH